MPKTGGGAPSRGRGRPCGGVFGGGVGPPPLPLPTGGREGRIVGVGSRAVTFALPLPPGIKAHSAAGPRPTSRREGAFAMLPAELLREGLRGKVPRTGGGAPSRCRARPCVGVGGLRLLFLVLPPTPTPPHVGGGRAGLMGLACGGDCGGRSSPHCGGGWEGGRCRAVDGSRPRPSPGR